MAVDLSDYVDALRREVTFPGSSTFASVPDPTFVGYLADAFWEVKLDGFIEPWVADSDGVIIPQNDPQAQTGNGPFNLTPYDPTVDIPRDQVALVVLYAGIKILRNNVLAQNTRLSAKAGPVEFTTENSANVLTEMLKELNAVKNRLLALKTFNQDVNLIDVFSARSSSAASYSGYLYDWYVGAFGADYSDIWSAGSYGVL
jgi:hypothetical protein